MLKALNQEDAAISDAAIDLKLSLEEQQQAEAALNEMAAVVEKQPVSDVNLTVDDITKDNPETKLLVSSILSTIENGSEQQIETVLQNAITSITAKVAKDKIEAKKQAAQLDEIVAVLEATHSTKLKPALDNAAAQFRQISATMRNADLGTITEMSRNQQFKLNPQSQSVNENIRSLNSARQTPRLDHSQLNSRQDVVRNMQLESQQGIKANLVDALAKTKEVYTKLQTNTLQEPNPAIRENYKQAANELSKQGKLIGEVAVQSSSIKQLMQEQVGRNLQQLADLNKQPIKGLDLQAQRVIQERDASLKVAKQQHVELQSLVRNDQQQRPQLQASKQADITARLDQSGQKIGELKKDNVVSLRPELKAQSPYPAIQPRPNELNLAANNLNKVQPAIKQPINDRAALEPVKLDVPITQIKADPKTFSNERRDTIPKEQPTIDLRKPSVQVFKQPETIKPIPSVNSRPDNKEPIIPVKTPYEPVKQPPLPKEPKPEPILKQYTPPITPEGKIKPPEQHICKPGCGCGKVNEVGETKAKLFQKSEKAPEYTPSKTPEGKSKPPEQHVCTPGCGCGKVNEIDETKAKLFSKQEKPVEYTASKTPEGKVKPAEQHICKPGCGCGKVNEVQEKKGARFNKPTTVSELRTEKAAFVKPHKQSETQDPTKTDFKVKSFKPLDPALQQQQLAGNSNR